ncbi:ATP-binding cassette subfamily B protein [Allocatelliglobosispora scoriae]|uniref:ATP-binding cassette subfamily B protein n=1 Tax=Allocatelliglobosispora scoriae TaxID=643052 RepID=A0A841BRT2_9ACTN|nr:ABC transporter ATP-binding protein [Allocatelliglobosispora scoriae]MBB5870108.1 ATP-binding cassette subfamily B protein [Allocatelliglobosispora scoriae]
MGYDVRRAGWLPLLGVTALVGVACNLALPLVLGRAVDAVITGADTARWLGLTAIIIAVDVAVGVIDTFANTAVVAATTARLRHRLIRHLLAIGPAGLRPFDSGDLVTRLVGNTADAARLGLSVMLVGLAAITPIASVVLLAVIYPWLVLAFLTGLALVVVMLRVFTRQTGEAVAAYQRIQGGIAARLTESLAGARTVAAAGTASVEEHRILRTLPELHEQGAISWRVLARSAGQVAVVGPTVQVAVLIVGGIAMVHGRISPGDLLAAGQYAAMGLGLGGVAGLLNQYARARAGAQRGREVLDRSAVAYGRTPLPAGPGRLEFRAVTADVGEVRVEVDLAIPGGAAVAFVGVSGAGKSVVAELATRLREPSSGAILLDGVDLSELTHDDLRSAVGCAFARPVLVGRTIRDAIAPSGPAAAVATRAHDFIGKLPHAYDTLLAEAPMSGGERQRLGLARAWHAERLLVLDDATSSLDMVTEMQISNTLTDDAMRRTRLIMTHRLSTAARADLVVWLDGGRVRATGTHRVLWEDPAYREVFR